MRFYFLLLLWISILSTKRQVGHRLFVNLKDERKNIGIPRNTREMLKHSWKDWLSAINKKVYLQMSISPTFNGFPFHLLSKSFIFFWEQVYPRNAFIRIDFCESLVFFKLYFPLCIFGNLYSFTNCWEPNIRDFKSFLTSCVFLLRWRNLKNQENKLPNSYLLLYLLL